MSGYDVTVKTREQLMAHLAAGGGCHLYRGAIAVHGISGEGITGLVSSSLVGELSESGEMKFINGNVLDYSALVRPKRGVFRAVRNYLFGYRL